MSKRISARDEHLAGSTHDHSELTATDNTVAGQVKRGLDVTIINDAVPIEVSAIGGRITEVSVNDSTWTALPTTALASRNALTVQNQSDREIKVNYDNTESGYVGIIIASGGERYYDIADAVTLYAKSESGTVTIAIEELA